MIALHERVVNSTAIITMKSLYRKSNPNKYLNVFFTRIKVSAFTIYRYLPLAHKTRKLQVFFVCFSLIKKTLFIVVIGVINLF